MTELRKSKMQIQEQLRQFIVNNFLYGQDNAFSNESSFLESGIIDSTGMLELIAFLEETYGFKVEDEELIPENLDSITNLVAFVAAKKGNSKAAVAQ